MKLGVNQEESAAAGLKKIAAQMSAGGCAPSALIIVVGLASAAYRRKDGVRKTFSGLMKIIYPSGVATKEEMRELLEFVMEGRKRVKDNLMRIDATYDPVDFWFEDLESGEKTNVQTLEGKEFPDIYRSLETAD